MLAFYSMQAKVYYYDVKNLINSIKTVIIVAPRITIPRSVKIFLSFARNVSFWLILNSLMSIPKFVPFPLIVSINRISFKYIWEDIFITDLDVRVELISVWYHMEFRKYVVFLGSFILKVSVIRAANVIETLKAISFNIFGNVGDVIMGII